MSKDWLKERKNGKYELYSTYKMISVPARLWRGDGAFLGS